MRGKKFAKERNPFLCNCQVAYEQFLGVLMEEHGRGGAGEISAEIFDGGVDKVSKEKRILLHLDGEHKPILMPEACLKPLIDHGAIVEVNSRSYPGERDIKTRSPISIGLW